MKVQFTEMACGLGMRYGTYMSSRRVWVTCGRWWVTLGRVPLRWIRLGNTRVGRSRIHCNTRGLGEDKQKITLRSTTDTNPETVNIIIPSFRTLGWSPGEHCLETVQY